MDIGQMRDFSEFCQQLNEVRLKFQRWDSCERTVALYYLMAGLPFANARFVQFALDHLVQTINTPETQNLEKQANDSKAISSFLNENPQTSLCLLLHHLPLLHPGNKEAAGSYLDTIRKILTEFITPPFKKIYNECVEIMSYVYIHPAFSKEDKKSFKHLLKQVTNKMTPDNFVHLPVTESSDESVSPNPESCENRHKPSMLIQDTEWSSQENILQTLVDDRQFLDMSQTSMSDQRLSMNSSVMKSTLAWLKSLRLHKYAWIFQSLTYYQMLNITEEHLMHLGVTKGARHKLMISIQRLNERSKLLEALEVEVMNGGDLNSALKKLKGVLQSPLEVSLGDDLPTQFIRVMGKACTQLLMLRQPTDENLVLFISMCERAAATDVFTEEHIKRLKLWQGQLSTYCGMPMYNRSQHNSKFIRDPRLTNLIKSRRKSSTCTSRKSSSYPNMQNSPNAQPHRHSIDSMTLQRQIYQVRAACQRHDDTCVQGENSNCVNKAPGFELDRRNLVYRNTENIESSLESLCLQMMEHALGP